MSTLADVFAAVRLQLDQAGFAAQATQAADKAGTTMAQRLNASLRKSWSGQEVGKGLIQGLGLAGGLGAAQLFSRAVTGVVDVLQDSVAAAREDQASKAALAGALRDQIKDWDGSTDAIERTIDARMRLGFTDEEQRLSIQKLLPVYKSEAKALEVSRAAMDLATFKRISLADATTQLVTIEGGQYRGLKQLIGSTKDITTSTEALAAVRAAAGDAAEDMANTDEGRLKASQIRQGEALEKLGYILLPAFTTATIAAADAVTTMADAIDKISRLSELTQPEVRDLSKTLIDIAAAIPVFGTGFALLRDVGKDAFTDVAVGADHAADSIENLKSNAGADLGTTETALEDTGKAASGMEDEIAAAALGSSKAFDDMKKSMVEAADDLIDKVYDPIITQDKLRATEAEIAAQREILASSKSSDAQKRDARDRLHELTKDNAEYLLSLAEAGQTGSKAYSDGIKELKDQIKKAKGPAKDALQEVLDKIREIEKVGKVVPINLIVAAQTSQWAKNLAGNMRASGGPVMRNEAYLVNEDTPRSELFVPNTPGLVIPRDVADALGGSGRDGDHLTVNVAGLLPVRTVADIRREMQVLGDVKRIRQPVYG